MNRIRGFGEISRIPNDIFIGLAVIVGMLLSTEGFPSIDLFFYGFASGFFISASIMISNDIIDIEIDRVNNPDRPLPSGLISITEAKILMITYIILGLIFSIQLTIYNFFIALGFWILGLAYNKHLKRRGFVGNLVVSASVAIPFIYGSIGVFGYPTQLSLVFALLAFLANTGREIIKGIIDLEGDRKYDVKTLAVTYGPFKASVIAALFIFASILLSPLPILMHQVNVQIYLLLVIVTDVLFFYSIIESVRSAKRRENRKLHKIKSLIFIGMGLGLLAFLLGVIT